MTKFLKKFGGILFLIILAFSLRVYKLGELPAGFTWDEAALGYNAYSILKTGRDEYGKLLPIILKSFGDYKPGLYVYLSVPFVLIFGLNEFAVRLPSAIFGTLTVLLLYFLVQAFFYEKKKRLPFLVAAAAATNPWLIHFSRGAWEANLAVFEVVLAVYLFVKFISTRKQIYGFCSSLIFGLTFLTYQGAKVFTSLLVLGLVIFWFKELKKISFPKVKLIAVPFLACFIFISLGVLGSRTGGRIKVMSLFSYTRPAEEIQKIKKEDGLMGNWLFPVFHSESLSFLRGFLGRYFNYFSGRFLFFEGDWSSKRHGPPYTGMILVVCLPFLVLGGYDLFSRSRNQMENFLLYWLLVAPIPAALTRDSIQAVRSLPMAIPLIFLAAVGAEYFFSLIKFRKLLALSELILFSLVFMNLIFYFDLYFVHYPIFSGKDWVYGYKEAVKFIALNQKNYEKVVLTQKFGQPYIFYLFYSKYDPSIYQKKAFLVENPYGDVGEVTKLDNIEFRTVYWPADRGLKNSLFVGSEYELPLQDIVGVDQFRVLKEIKYADGNLAFRIVETR